MCESVIEFARKVAKQDCTLVLKVLQGSEFQSFIQSCKSQFKQVHLMKPKASRKESVETYCILRSFINSVVFLEFRYLCCLVIILLTITFE